MVEIRQCFAISIRLYNLIRKKVCISRDFVFHVT